MASRRRLSHHSELECLGELLEDDDDDEWDEQQRLLMLRKVKNSRNSIGGGGGRMSTASNRSSMGLEQSAEEQNRIAEMYKTVIKMSSENVSVYSLSEVIL
jgi:hypothetical protein